MTFEGADFALKWGKLAPLVGLWGLAQAGASVRFLGVCLSVMDNYHGAKGNWIHGNPWGASRGLLQNWPKRVQSALFAL